MLATDLAAAGHPAVAALLGLGTAGLAAAVVAMAWNVHVRQIRLAEQLARRQYVVTKEASAANGAANVSADPEATAELGGANGAGASSAVVIEGPETVVTGQQARFRVRAAGGRKAVSWAAGGGAVSQSPDPAHPDELLLIADRPGALTVSARVREGMTERRGIKPIKAVADVTTAAPPFTLRLFLHGWGLVAVAVLIIGFAGTLDALGNLSSPDFIALVTPMAALIGVVALARGPGETPGGPSAGKDAARGP